MSELPLKGIRVLDLSMVFSGPLCSRILADLGAEVIKVEAIQRPDSSRNLSIAENDPQDEGWNRSGYFVKLNMNKKGITLDLANSEGREVLKRLVRIADVLVENYSPRVLPNFGLGYEVLRQLNPSLILASLSGYGQTGPWSLWGAYGYSLEYACGLSSISGYADGGPGKQGINYTDPWGGILAAGLIVVALHQRRRTGEGQWIDLSQRDLGASFLGEALTDYALNGRVQGRLGNRHASMAPHGHYRCQGDREWVAIAVSTDAEWRALRMVLGDPEWARDPLFDTVSGRLANQDVIDDNLEQWTRQRDHYAAMRQLQAAGVAAGAVLNNRELVLEPNLHERGIYETVDHPRVGRRPYPRLAQAFFSGWPAAGWHPAPAPLLGQDNKQVLRDLLGMEESEIAQLAERRIIGTAPVMEEMPAAVVTEIFRRRLELQQRLGKIEALDPDYRRTLGIE